MLCICCRSRCLFFCVHGFVVLMMLVVLLLVTQYVLKYGLLIFCVVKAHAHCCLSCAFCTVIYACACISVYTHIPNVAEKVALL